MPRMPRVPREPRVPRVPRRTSKRKCKRKNRFFFCISFVFCIFAARTINPFIKRQRYEANYPIHDHPHLPADSDHRSAGSQL